MAKSSKKATRKFEKNHLKDTIEQRKQFKKFKGTNKNKAAAKSRRSEEQGYEKPGSKDTAKLKNGVNAAEAADLDDDFFQGDAELPTPLKKIDSKKRKRAAAGEGEAVSVEVDPTQDSAEEGSDVDAGDDLEMHKGDLDALAKKDPEFYKYLKENDAELLDFSEGGDLSEVDELSASDTERPAKKQKRKEKDKADVDSPKVTSALIQKWKTALSEEHSVGAMRQVVLAFRAAAHINEDEQEYKYTIPNPDVYHQLVSTALRDVPKALQYHLPTKEAAGGKMRVPTDSKKFKSLTPLIKSYSSSVHHLLTTLSDAPTLNLTLTSFEPLVPYLLQFRKFLKLVIRTIANVWSTSSYTETVRINAFLVLRRLMTLSDPGVRNQILKSVYEGLVKGSRNTTAHTLSSVNLMKNSAAELWGLDSKVGYTTGFTFIRQLAIHLRSTINQPTKDSYKQIYNWQYVHSLDFWSRVLSAQCDPLAEAQSGKQSPLRPLIYPVVQITLGAMRLIPTAQYFPLRFQLMRSLLRISSSTGTYIPLAAALLEVLNSAEMKKPPKQSTLRPLDFNVIIRTPTQYLRTRVYQDGVGEQVCELLGEYFVLWAKSIAFPEMALPITVMLKRWLKGVASKTNGNRNAKVSQMVGLVVQKLESNGRWIEERRSRVTFSPKDREEVEGFLKETGWEKTPFGGFVQGQRRLREEKKRVLDQGRKEEERQKKEERGGSEDEEHVPTGGGVVDVEDSDDEVSSEDGGDVDE